MKKSIIKFEKSNLTEEKTFFALFSRIVKFFTILLFLFILINKLKILFFVSEQYLLAHNK